MGEGAFRGNIAIDAMGGDYGTAEVVRGVVLALQQIKGLEGLLLVGKERLLTQLAKSAGLAGDKRISIYPASEVIGMDEKPIESLKRKKDASMLRAIELVKEGKCKAIISCGNTGSLMAGSTLRLRTMPGVERPALAAVMPAKLKHFILIDAGANASAKPEHLVHNAILGSHYGRVVLGIDRPRVGLLSNGTEEGKGNELTQAAHNLLKQVRGIIAYEGPIEGFHVFSNKVDVIVTDGFTGNIMMKSCESLFLSMKDFLKEEIAKSPIRLTGALLSKGAYNIMRDQLNPDNSGGAPFLGLRGHVRKVHGSSNRFAFMNAIRVAKDVVDMEMDARALADIEKANEIIRSPAGGITGKG
jgi:glycerol-3-phosphate acyltransferase PlsX